MGTILENAKINCERIAQEALDSSINAAEWSEKEVKEPAEYNGLIYSYERKLRHVSEDAKCAYDEAISLVNAATYLVEAAKVIKDTVDSTESTMRAIAELKYILNRFETLS